jgi:hypothetical protein
MGQIKAAALRTIELHFVAADVHWFAEVGLEPSDDEREAIDGTVETDLDQLAASEAIRQVARKIAAD